MVAAQNGETAPASPPSTARPYLPAACYLAARIHLKHACLRRLSGIYSPLPHHYTCHLSASAALPAFFACTFGRTWQKEKAGEGTRIRRRLPVSLGGKEGGREGTT